jgi:murein L,D-transpeptidase YcbB/YkuD
MKELQMLHAAGQRLAVSLLLCLIALPLPAAEESVEVRLRQMLQTGAASERPGGADLDWPALRALYERAGWRLLWRDPQGGANRAMRQELEQWVRAAWRHGLDPAGYHQASLQPPLSAASVNRSEPVWDDLLLSHDFMRLARELAGVIPAAPEHDRLWHLPPRTLDAPGLLLQVAATGEVGAALQPLPPRAAEYRRLMEHYVQLSRRQAREGWVPPNLDMAGLLREGESHPAVATVRERLIREELLDAAPSSLEPQERYTPLVVAAVRAFQQRQGLEPDGILGPATRAALQRSPQQRLQQVRANLQRWRWLPRELGERYLLVRIGSYSMTLVEQERAVRHYRVITGRPQRPTLAFASRVDHLIIDPPWTVPYRLAVEDLLPKQQKDPNYFARQQIEVLQRVEGQWRSVDPESVAWQSLSRRHFPYLLRQRPGPLNSLGRIRFGMSNPYSIYLHDTPHRELFGATQRAFSSGCVRVEAIEELARRLLDERSLEQALSDPATHRLSLEQPLPVYLVYLTVWVDERQQAHYHPDLYGLDEQLQQALGPLPEPPDAATKPGTRATTVAEE